MATLILLVGMALGATLVLIGIVMLIAYRRIRLRWRRWTAEVTGLERRVEEETAAFWPHYRYTYDGRCYTAEGACGSDPPAYAVGQSIVIYVDPQRPDQSEIADCRFVTVPAVLLVLGTAILLLAPWAPAWLLP